MRIPWILRIVYLFLLVLYIVTWAKFAIEGHYREIVDDLPAIMFFAILWDQRKHTIGGRKEPNATRGVCIELRPWKQP